MGGGGPKIFFNVDFSKRKYLEIYQDVFKINIERMKMKVLISLKLYAKKKKETGSSLFTSEIQYHLQRKFEIRYNKKNTGLTMGINLKITITTKTHLFSFWAKALCCWVGAADILPSAR